MHKPDQQQSLTQVDCETIIKEGDAREVICSFVLEYEPDLLIVGSRGPATILNRSVTMPITSCAFRVRSDSRLGLPNHLCLLVLLTAQEMQIVCFLLVSVSADAPVSWLVRCCLSQDRSIL